MISSYFNGVDNYSAYWDRADQFLKTFSKKNVPSSVWTKMEELDPKNSNYCTLATHRKGKLVQDIDAIFEKIKPQYLPISIDPFDQGMQDLKKLKEKCSQSAYDFHRELKKVQPDLRTKIYAFVWILSGCPREPSFSEFLLKRDLSVLKREFSFFKEHRPKPVLDEVEEDFLLDLRLKKWGELKQDCLPEELQSVVSSKVQFFERCFEDRTTLTHIQMKALFRFMPLPVQHQLALKGIQPPFYGRGFNPKLHETLGAHFNAKNGRTHFAVYAPHAREIILHLTAFKKIEHALSMVKGGEGIWRVETDKAPPGRSYHFMITGDKGGEAVKKVDPFAFQNIIHNLDSKRNKHESQVVDIDKEFLWTDQEWMVSRVKRNFSKEPLIIYEVHAPSWMLSSSGKPPNWRELALKLAEYCKRQGYNAVELMGLFAHPHPISMGYQITNFFAFHSEMGSSEDLQYFVNHMHEKGILVIIDWVPAHFALDDYALSNFDGTPLLEDDDPRYQIHSQWGTKVFDYKKQWTKDFLASNICFLLEKGHFDGFRMDAVASMLYLNYFRPEHEHRFNRRGNDINLSARAFLRNLNTYLSQEFPGVVRIAEESSGCPNVVRSSFEKGIYESGHEKKKTRGLGFDMTWHMSFMNRCIDSVSQDICDFKSFVDTVKNVDGNEDICPRGRAILPFSHDENANDKGTLFTKMPGNTEEEKFARFRFITAYQLLRGGGGVLEFPGNQQEEWHFILIKNTKDPQRARPTFDQEALKHPLHGGAHESSKDLHHLWLQNPGLWDQTDMGFSWMYTDPIRDTLGFHRRSYNTEGGIVQQFACIFNTSKEALEDYLISLPGPSDAPELDLLGSVHEVYNSDKKEYGGDGRVNLHVEILRDENERPIHFKLRLPPSSVLVLEEKFL